MKAFLVSIFVGLACVEVPAQFDAIIQSMTKIAEQCKQQTNATEDLQQLINTFTLPTTPEGKCMVACVMRNLSLMKGDQVDYEVMDKFLLNLVPRDLFRPFVQIVLNLCHSAGSGGKDGCENAAAYASCAKKAFS